ncbi:hydrogenase small subunit [Inmirania thermothiophila]|uniref:hydrogenase (acceptor) n=1 Tax=Inmirania thermothiophila TaxID=1750597 RepID=A0A3N1Y1Z1_9GAMM|nr:hydrogenase small subunit [Inmirania thermothiophila]ROR32541.1 hydrogenase small subunit [Inmirania thermothiophila]
MNIEELIERTDLGAAAAARIGCSRRDFMKFMGTLAGTMGLTTAGFARMVEAADAPRRPPVIWLSGQECTGCTESLLRAEHPTLEALILDTVSLDYSETLCAPAGHWAEKSKRDSMKTNWGKYVLVIEGAIPTKDDGVYCKIAGRTMLEHVREAAEGAAAILAIGSCASWGGIPSSGPNPTGARGAPQVLAGKTVITIPGCPPNPYNFLSTVLYLLTFGKAPELDAYGRPRFAYGRLIHENCERRAHFDAGRFARQFGDEGHRKGWCLYKLGCKGPETYANCPQILFGDVGVGSWPVGTGHPCFGCTEQGVGFTKAIHELAEVKTYAPPATFPRVDEPVGEGVTPTAAALLGAVGGVVVGAAAMATRRLAAAEKPQDGQDGEA